MLKWGLKWITIHTKPYKEAFTYKKWRSRWVGLSRYTDILEYTALWKVSTRFEKCVTPDCHSKYFLYVGLTSYLMSSIHADLSHPFFQKILRAHGMCARCYKKEAPFLWPVKSIRTYCLLFTSAFNQYLTLADSRPKFSASNLIMLINMLWKLKGLIF